MREEQVLKRIAGETNITPTLRRVTQDLADFALSSDDNRGLSHFCQELARISPEGAAPEVIGYREALFDLMAAIDAAKVKSDILSRAARLSDEISALAEEAASQGLNLDLTSRLRPDQASAVPLTCLGRGAEVTIRESR